MRVTGEKKITLAKAKKMISAGKEKRSKEKESLTLVEFLSLMANRQAGWQMWWRKQVKTVATGFSSGGPGGALSAPVTPSSTVLVAPSPVSVGAKRGSRANVRDADAGSVVSQSPLTQRKKSAVSPQAVRQTGGAPPPQPGGRRASNGAAGAASPTSRRASSSGADAKAVQSAAAAPEKKKPASINDLLARRDTDDVDDDESRGNVSDLSEEELDDPRNEQVRGGARASSRHEHRARCLRPDSPARHRRRDERAV